MSDIRFNSWFHRSGTGGVFQDGSGRVGIGSTQPVSHLDLNGGTLTGNVTGNVTGNTSGTAGGLSGTPDITVNNVTAGIVTATSFSGDGSSLTGISAGYWQSTDVGINTLSSVGIGTTNPTTKVEIQSSANDSLDNPQTIFLRDTNTAGQGKGPGLTFGFDYNASGNHINRAGQIKCIKENSTDGNYASALIFGTTQHATSTAEKVRIDSSGNVGIGTDSPDTTVHIEDAQAELIVKSTGSNSAGFRLIPNNDTNALYIYADTSRNINIDDHATGRLQVQADGDLSITDGNLVLASGHGIDFSATAGTGDSELLDDYEEGTWTPRLNGWNGSSYVNVSNTTNAVPGHYIKIGRKVTLFIRYEWSSMPVNNGHPLYIYDLPFNVTNDHHSAGSMARIGGITNPYDLRIYKFTGSTNMLYIQTAEATNLTGMYGNNGQFIAEITYMASS